MDNDLDDVYLDYAKAVGEAASLGLELSYQNKLIYQLKSQLNSQGGIYGTEFTAHAFRHISERLEELCMESEVIYEDCIKPDNLESSLLFASNLKSFIITLLANAKKKNNVEVKPSKNSDGEEYHFITNIKKWSDPNEKDLQFIGVVENNHLKTGFFNWV